MNDLRALSVWQPWAWLIVRGYKDIENRTWQTGYRGTILIHAPKKFDYDGYNWIVRNRAALGIPEKVKAPILSRRAIHTGATEEFELKGSALAPLPFIHQIGAGFPVGGIVGAASIVGCFEFDYRRDAIEKKNPWAEGPWCWRLAGAMETRLVPMPGRLGFFAVPLDVQREAGFWNVENAEEGGA